MSQSPVDPADAEQARQADSPFRVSLSQMNGLIRRGGTFSGHERNCVYLNTGRGRFANISAVSGLDFPDDARAHALVDWDHDGDLDIWTANRTAPQLRFQRNDFPSSDTRFVAFRLEGRRCNRDAIGARIEVFLQDTSPTKLVKSLRAGEGFLGQSTKWIHFGLGKAHEIQRVLVHWPGDSSPDVFPNVAVNHFYHVKQDEARLRRVTYAPAVEISPSVVELPAQGGAHRTLLTSRIPLPSLEYQTWNGQVRSLDQFLGAPLLVNLWASWCAPCLEELANLAREEKRISEAGLQIVALSVDGVDAQSKSDPDHLEAVVQRTGFRFVWGIATPSLLDVLQYLSDLRFSQHRTMPLPSSLLIDRQGRIAAIYRGVLPTDVLLQDVANLSLPDEDWQRMALPLAGRWHRFPTAPGHMVIPLHLLRNGMTSAALGFVDRFGELLEENKEFPRLLVWLGDELFQENRTEEGIRQYERALEHDSRYVPAMNNIAWKLATFHDARVRDGEQAVFWARRAAEATAFRSAAVLDTLAAAYAEDGQFREAVETARRAIQLASSQQQQELAESIEQNLRQYEQQQPLRTREP